MAGQSKWRKMKLALGLNTCLYVPESSDDGESVKSSSRSCSDARRRLPITPTPSSSGLRVSKYSDKSTSEPVCAICLMPMKATGTDAIFKAECTHSFHYHCIASNVKYGNRACPVCRAKWKEIPLTTSGSCVKSNTNTDDYTMVMSPQQLHAYQMINSLVANGGTNIAEALRKGAKVMTDRKFKNPVSSMILLSDGQDSDANFSPRKLNLNYQSLSSSIQVKSDENRIPIHTFGFGTDHDACALHAISEHSGGMFSFIEAENVIQDAFAQCIGGLLSVVVQELRVEVECVHPVLRLGSIKAGSYKVGMDENARSGFIEVGDLYAEEERDFLVTMDIPVEKSSNIMSLVKFRAIHKDPIKKTVVTVGGNEDLIILRPETSLKKQTVSIEVDRQRNRLMAADAISEARTMAERGNLTAAVSVLEECRKKLADSVSGRGGDRLCVGLMAELREMKERMVSHRVYESSGRAYVLSGLSSHSWQRATARGDSTETTSIIQSYQTQTMVNMVNLSQTTSFIRSPSTSMVSPNSPKTEPLKTKKSLRSTHSFT
ncbi:putative transcription factor C2H2 family [Helianthus debilis subsp. tardiflorus]